MGFISYDFLIFFLIVFALYWLFPKRRWQNFLLLLSSVVFYGWLAPWHSAVLLASIIVDYFLALGMIRWKSRSSALMWLGIALNLSLLFSIKYFPVYRNALITWTDQVGFSSDVFLASILLPLGVSFYVLKKISFLVEVNRGTLSPAQNFIDFAAYISFFPQVLSGPIDRPNKFLKQLEESRAWSSANFYKAWQLIVMGLFKKIVIANTIKVLVDQVFLMQEPSKIFLIVGGLSFTLQIIADFSSYTDLSRGLAFLLGLETMENFDKPYLVYTPSQFWNRWHISFSSWLRDYIFFPVRRMLLKAKRIPEFISQSIPPLVTMFISGLWHGTGLTFIVWGLYYGMLIVIYQSLGLHGNWKPANVMKRFFAWLLMFLIIVFGWVIFRASSMNWLWSTLLHAPVYRNTEELIASLFLLSMTAFYALPIWIKQFMEQRLPNWFNLHAAYYAVATLLILVFMNSSSPDFIYFQF